MNAKARWIESILVGAFALLLAACGTKIKTPPEPPPERPQALAYELVDGWVVVATRFEKRSPLPGVELFDLRGTALGEVDWSVETGEVRIVRDPFNGATLFRPLRGEPVRVRPRHRGLAGEPIEIGIASEFLNLSERVFLAAGGGACMSNSGHPALSAVVGDEFTVDVRSVVNTSVQPLSASKRSLVYQHAQYHAWSPEAGPMRIRFNPEYVSRTNLRSLGDPATPEDPFFPAAAETNLHFVIDFLDHGISVFNKDPMRLRSGQTSWPPFRVPQVNESGDATEFYMVGQPDVLMMTILSQEQYVYPTTELLISSERFTIDDQGLLEATFEIENRSEHSGRIRWFILGDYGYAESPREGVLDLSPSGREQISFSARPEKRLLGQFITLGAVSEAGPRLTGSKRLEFRYPAETPLRTKLLKY